ncbi:MAG: 4Fe-4S binding protein [Dehalococcoidia bacterium]|nr:MAG: 4Fe-4S binding protein [Dehalococcoidia bacterium]
MTGSNTIDLIISALENAEFSGKVIPIEYLEFVKKEIQNNYSNGVLNDAFYHERLSHFQHTNPTSSKNIRSIFITSAPQPQQKVKFKYKGNHFSFTVPPTYSYETDQKIEKIILGILKNQGLNLYPASLPLKLIAAHSGLVSYGKNNITYVDKMGSYHRLQAFYSDISVDTYHWGDYKLLENCKSCNACLKACPTKAISSERFIIKAENCITFHNERLNSFPKWIEGSWHNCLIGCMTCQLVCPANKRVNKWIEGCVDFNERETSLILKGERGHLPDITVKKLQKLDLLEDFNLIPRNLQVLLNNYLSES